MAFANDHDGIEACVAKPGLVARAGSAYNFILKSTRVVPVASVEEVSRAMLKQVVSGFEKEVLENSDLVRLGA
jgi:hypothetical protein